MDTGIPQFRRAWTTDGGGHIRFESRAYSSPTFGFANGEQNDDLYFDPPPQRSGRPPSLLRTAFTMIGAVQEMRRDRAQQRAQEARPSTSRRSSRYDDPPRDRQTRHRDRASPPRSSRRESYREDVEEPPPAGRERKHDDMRSLEQVVLDEEAEIDDCSRWLSRNAHREDISERRISQMTQRLQEHKRRLGQVKDKIRSLRAAQEQEYHNQPRPSPRRRRTEQSTPSAPDALPPDVEEMFNFFFSSFPAAGAARGSESSRLHTPHAQVFEHFFSGMGGPRFVFRNMHGQTSGNAFFPGASSAHWHSQGSHARPARPPISLRLLAAREAQDLYQAYNARWTALAPTDANVPYPGRELKPAALLMTDSIHAPTVTAPVSAWSKEDIVRANTQYFFLTVATFTPTFSDRAGKIEMDFDHSRASGAQLQLLADMLKKEKLRWHSDRLGRRNGGQSGINTALQQDEVTRAVFHAVCELSDLVQTKRP